MDDGLMTQRQVADHLCLSTRTIREYVRRGWLVQIQLGRTLRYRRPDVDGLVEKARQLGLKKVRQNLAQSA